MKFDTNTSDLDSQSMLDFDDDFDQGTLECWGLNELSDVVRSDFSAAVGSAMFEQEIASDVELYNEFD